MSLGKIRGADRNPKKHDLPGIMSSIRRFGFKDFPCINETTGKLVSGHGRVMALKKLKREGRRSDDEQWPPENVTAKGNQWLCPVVRGQSWVNDQEAEAYLAAHNQLTMTEGWDEDVLAKLLLSVNETDAGLEGLGFDDDYVQKLLGEQVGGSSLEPSSVTETDVPDTPEEPTTQLGDIWILGDHVLVCGDAANPDVLRRATRGDLVDMVWTDPPYGVDYFSPGRAISQRKGKDTKQHAPIKNDGAKGLEMLLRSAFGALFEVTKQGAPWYVAAPSGPTHIVFGVVLGELGVHRQTIAWVKDTFVLGRSHFHSRYESIFYGWTPGASCLHSPPDRKQDTVWEFARPKVSLEHPTMKPTALVAHAIEISSSKGAHIVDSFGGSGTVLMAAEQLGRRASLVELSPAYCDVIVTRWSNLTGKQPVRNP